MWNSFYCVVYEPSYWCVLEHTPVVQPFVPAQIVARRFVWQQHSASLVQLPLPITALIRVLGSQTSVFNREETRHLSLFWRRPGISNMVRFHVCPVALILLLAMAGGLGSVYGLGEDLDRPLFGPPGSPIRLQESDPGLQKALNFAEERYNRGSNAMHLRKVSRLVSATRQVCLLYNTYIYTVYINIYIQTC